jgi:hypothetical protein
VVIPWRLQSCFLASWTGGGGQCCCHDSIVQLPTCGLTEVPDVASALAVCKPSACCDSTPRSTSMRLQHRQYHCATLVIYPSHIYYPIVALDFESYCIMLIKAQSCPTQWHLHHNCTADAASVGMLKPTTWQVAMLVC